MLHKTFRSKKYDDLYQLSKGWITYMNPCEIHVANSTNDFSVSCVKYKEGNPSNLLCCGPTEVKSEQELFNTSCINHCNGKGCTVKSLSCQQFFCMEAWENIFNKHSPIEVREFIQCLQYVSQETRLHLIPNFPRSSKRNNFIRGEKFLK
jgi:hypothetical protein